MELHRPGLYEIESFPEMHQYPLQKPPQQPPPAGGPVQSAGSAGQPCRCPAASDRGVGGVLPSSASRVRRARPRSRRRRRAVATSGSGGCRAVVLIGRQGSLRATSSSRHGARRRGLPRGGRAAETTWRQHFTVRATLDIGIRFSGVHRATRPVSTARRGHPTDRRNSGLNADQASARGERRCGVRLMP